LTTENGHQFAERLLDEKYGKGSYPTGPAANSVKSRRGVIGHLNEKKEGGGP
jgi:hypothetical protein